MTPSLRARLGFGADQLGERALLARAGFYLFAAGGLLGFVTLALPGGSGRSAVAIFAVALAALLLGVLELVLFERLPVWAFPILTGCGTVLVSAAIYFGGSGARLYSFFYFWVALYAAYFFEWLLVGLEVVLVAAAYVVVLFLRPGPEPRAVAWVLTTGTLAVVAALVLLLRRRLERLLAGEREQVTRLRELDRLKDELVATISHELRTPVAAIFGALETLRRRSLDQPSRVELFAIAARESQRLFALVDRVLTASGIDNDRLRLQIEPCDAGLLAEEAAASLRARMPSGVTIDVAAEPALPAVAADPAKLRQVLVNLLDNAVKYSPGGGRIELHLRRQDETVRLIVRDEGIGLPAEERERIFEKFHRLDPHLTRGVSGSGLGLYICRELVRAMRGHIWVESLPSQGATFFVELPVVGVSPSAGEADAEVGRLEGAERPRRAKA